MAAKIYTLVGVQLFLHWMHCEFKPLRRKCGIQGEWELPLICIIAEQNLSFRLLTPKQLLNYGVGAPDDNVGSWKHKSEHTS